MGGSETTRSPPTTSLHSFLHLHTPFSFITHLLSSQSASVIMSWQAYVDQQLVGTGHITQGAILGLDGGAWATTAGFSVAEGAALAALFSNPSNAFSSGVTVAGTKYLAIKADNRSIYGKKGSGGVCLVKTGQSVLVGVYADGSGIQPGNAANAVEKLADYLIE